MTGSGKKDPIGGVRGFIKLPEAWDENWWEEGQVWLFLLTLLSLLVSRSPEFPEEAWRETKKSGQGIWVCDSWGGGGVCVEYVSVRVWVCVNTCVGVRCVWYMSVYTHVSVWIMAKGRVCGVCKCVCVCGVEVAMDRISTTFPEKTWGLAGGAWNGWPGWRRASDELPSSWGERPARLNLPVGRRREAGGWQGHYRKNILKEARVPHCLPWKELEPAALPAPSANIPAPGLPSLLHLVASHSGHFRSTLLFFVLFSSSAVNPYIMGFCCSSNL